MMTRSWFALVTAMLALALFGAVGCGCGDDDDDDSGGGDDDDTAPDDDADDDDDDDDVDDDDDDDVTPNASTRTATAAAPTVRAERTATTPTSTTGIPATPARTPTRTALSPAATPNRNAGTGLQRRRPGRLGLSDRLHRCRRDYYPGTEREICAPSLPLGYYDEPTDCDDTDPMVNPDGIDIPDDGIDQDCDDEDYTAQDSNGYFVDGTDGDDGNAGTKAAPFETIQKGVDAAETVDGGLNVYIAEGNYDEDVLLATASLYGGYEAAAWTRAVDFHVTTITGQTDHGLTGILSGPVVVDGLVLNGKDGIASSAGAYLIGSPGSAALLSNNEFNGGDTNTNTSFGLLTVTLENLFVANNVISSGTDTTNSNFAVYGVNFNSSYYNNILNVTETTGAGTSGLFETALGDYRAENNVINMAPGATNSWGIFVTSASNGPVDLVNNEVTGVESGTGPAWGAFITLGNIWMEGNRFDGITSTDGGAAGIFTTAGNGLYLNANTVTDVSGYNYAWGIFPVVPGPSWVVSNNVVEIEDVGNGVEVGLYLTLSYNSGVVVNNTIVTGTAESHNYGIIHVGSAGAALVNNIVETGSSNTGNSWAFIEAGSAGTGAVRLYNNNLRADDCLVYETDGPTCYDQISDVNDCAWYNCDDAMANTSANPGFVNPGGNNYRLASASAMIDSGTNPFLYYGGPGSSFFWEDFEGDVRPNGSTWDKGADEFVPGP
ncbi:MAG: right-handed parallel beta-helix repeat-containing protein [Deltaproteobacteria bacterium]|nr:right-handed parallel beta-helix repeat-containing protein [Deltaproteobacteria bacterium]